MNGKPILWIGVIAAIALACQSTDIHQGTEASVAVGDDAMSQDALMEAWMTSGEPGPHHEHMKQFLGRWKSTSTFWNAPGEEPTQAGGEMTYESLYDGRFLLARYEGEMFGAPFSGLSTLGYNNVRKRYESIWIDNVSSSHAMSVGTCDASGKTFTMSMENWDPISGRKKTSREIIRILSPERHEMLWYDKGPDGKEFMSAKIVYEKL